jgi:hypothetical protein
MKKAKFIYVDKQKNIYPFVLPVSNDHNGFNTEQAVQLKEIGLTTPKLYDLIAVETFIPRLHHSKPTVIFDQYIEQENERSEIDIAKDILKKHGYIGVDTMFQIADIIGRAEDRDITLTNEQAIEIGENVSHFHDCNIGINWENIDFHTDELLNNN